jgi:hypothetical protein
MIGCGRGQRVFLLDLSVFLHVFFLLLNDVSFEGFGSIPEENGVGLDGSHFVLQVLV